MFALNLRSINWRWFAAATFFLCGLIGLLAGTSLSERPDVVGSSWLVKAYYALGFFVFGGLDIGVPDGGPQWARGILWVAYFGAPTLTASTVMEAVFQALAPDRWKVRRHQDHIIVYGSGRLTESYLTQLRERNTKSKVIVIAPSFSYTEDQELQQKFDTTTLIGDITHDYMLNLVKIHKAKRVLLLGDDDFYAFEAASRILDLAPELTGRIVLHCNNLRFMRSLANTQVAQRCEVFNTYNVAARQLVRGELVQHFAATANKDFVVMAGFGRFGQSVLEELHAVAEDEIAEVAVIDRDADRRILVVDEQQTIVSESVRNVLEGDIGHPQVWAELTALVDLSINEPTIVLGTGQEQENLRTAVWIKGEYPNALVFARTSNQSKFAEDVGSEHGIQSISIAQLVADSIPDHWVD